MHGVMLYGDESDMSVVYPQLPESERASLKAEENAIAILQRKLEDSERRCSESFEDNLDMRQEVRDLHLEMEEMHDQFRDDEAIEFHEIQKELEAAAKNCRILQVCRNANLRFYFYLFTPRCRPICKCKIVLWAYCA